MSLSLALVVVAFASGSLADGHLQLPGRMGHAGTGGNAYVVFFNLSWGPVMWVMLGEMFPNQIRGSALAVAGAAQWTSNFVVTVTFPMLLAAAGLAATRHLPGGCRDLGDLRRPACTRPRAGTGADGRMSTMTSQAFVIRSGALVAALMRWDCSAAAARTAAAAAATDKDPWPEVIWPGCGPGAGEAHHRPDGRNDGGGQGRPAGAGRHRQRHPDDAPLRLGSILAGATPIPVAAMTRRRPNGWRWPTPSTTPRWTPRKAARPFRCCSASMPCTGRATSLAPRCSAQHRAGRHAQSGAAAADRWHHCAGDPCHRHGMDVRADRCRTPG